MTEEDDIQARLKESSQACLDSYQIWAEKRQDSKAQEGLRAAIHELRKVSSRLEIELAMSERDQITSRPIPIPAHRSNSRADRGAVSDDFDSSHDSGAPVVQTKPKRKRLPRKQTGTE